MGFWSGLKTAITDIEGLVGIHPIIEAAVKNVEASAAGTTGTGAAKIVAVGQTVLAAVQTAAPDVLASIGESKLLSYVQTVAGILVTLFNAIGIFKKSTPAPPAV